MVRYRYFDYMKGLSIIGVIVIHVLLLVPRSHDSYYIAALIDSSFRFAVPLFIFILGFMTYEKYINVFDWQSFYKNKFVYLVLPYFLWTNIYYFTPNVFSDYQEDESYINSLLFGESEVHFYYMIAYFLFLLLTPAVVVLIRKVPKRNLVLILVLSVITHIGFLYHIEINIRAGVSNLYTDLNSKTPIHWVSYYAIGILLAIYKREIIKISWKAKNTLIYIFPLLFVGYIAFLLWFVITDHHYFSYYSPFLFLLTTLALVLISAIYYLTGRFKFSNIFTWLGKYSYPIYLSHIAWIILMSTFMDDISLLGLVITFIGSLLLSCVYALAHNHLFAKKP